MDAQSVLVHCGGAATWRRLRGSGVPWRQLRTALRSGEVLRLRRGVYALPDAPPDLVAALRLGGVLAGPSAARHYGWDVLLEDQPWIAVRRDWGHAALPGVRVVRVDPLAAEVACGVTSPLRTLLDCARRLPLREAVCILDSALHGGFPLRQLQMAAAAARGPGSAAARRAVALADGRSESVIETCVRLILVALGLSVRPQVWVRGVGWVDLVVDGWLAIEGDGFAFHSDRTAYREDRRRARAPAAEGYVLLRFTYEEAVYEPHVVVQSVLAVLATRGRAA